MKRSEVNQKDIWRTEDIFINVADWEREFGELNKALPQILGYKGKLHEKSSFVACMQLNSALMQRLERVMCYAQLKHDENGTDEVGTSLYGKAENLYMHYATYASYITPELGELDDLTLSAYLNDPDLAVYHYMLSEVKRSKRHILSQVEE